MSIHPRRIHGIGFTGQNSAGAAINSGGRSALTTAFFGGNAWLDNQYEWREWNVPMEAGTWTLTVVYMKTPAGGVVTPSIDGTDLTTFDTKLASGVPDYIYQASGITVTSTGVKALRFRCDSTFATESPYYQARLQGWELVRTDTTTASGNLAFDAKHIDIVPWMYGFDAASGATFGRADTEFALLGGWGGTGSLSGDDGDTYSWYVALAAGTWKVTFTYFTGPTCGRFDQTLGGATVGTTIDMYTALSGPGAATYTGITVSSDGVYELKFITNGKNTSATDYDLRLSLITLVKTA